MKSIGMSLREFAKHDISPAQLQEPTEHIWHLVRLRYLRLLENAAQWRWESAHLGLDRAWMDALCERCGKTVACSIEFKPRHADSRQEAVAICHGLVEYHLINDGCGD